MSMDLGQVLLEQIRDTDAAMRASFAGVQPVLGAPPIELLRGWKLINKETLALCDCTKDKAKLTEIDVGLNLMIAYKSWCDLLPLFKDALQDGCDTVQEGLGLLADLGWARVKPRTTAGRTAEE